MHGLQSRDVGGQPVELLQNHLQVLLAKRLLDSRHILLQHAVAAKLECLALECIQGLLQVAEIVGAVDLGIRLVYDQGLLPGSCFGDCGGQGPVLVYRSRAGVTAAHPPGDERTEAERAQDHELLGGDEELEDDREEARLHRDVAHDEATNAVGRDIIEIGIKVLRAMAAVAIAGPADREVQLRIGFGATTDAIDPRRRVGDPLRTVGWTPG